MSFNAKYYRSIRDLEEEMLYSQNYDEASRRPEGVTKEEVEDYVSSVVSGKMYDAVCELGTLCAGGKMIVSYGRLKEMVDEGYNIVSAEVTSPYRIDIVYQKYEKDKSKGMGR